jgi:hypothetical protein
MLAQERIGESAPVRVIAALACRRLFQQGMQNDPLDARETAATGAELGYPIYARSWHMRLLYLRCGIGEPVRWQPMEHLRGRCRSSG